MEYALTAALVLCGYLVWQLQQERGRAHVREDRLLDRIQAPQLVADRVAVEDVSDAPVFVDLNDDEALVEAEERMRRERRAAA